MPAGGWKPGHEPRPRCVPAQRLEPGGHHLWVLEQHLAQQLGGGNSVNPTEREPRHCGEARKEEQ